MLQHSESQVNNGKGSEVSQHNPCPLCAKEDWCYIYPDGNVCCGRTDIAPPGWKIIGKGKDDRNIFALIQDKSTQSAYRFKKVLPSVTRRTKAFKAAPLPDKIVLAKGSIPKSEKKLHHDSRFGECYLTIYDYGEERSVYRYESVDGSNLPGKKSHKICLPFSDGKFEKGDEIWEAYRLYETLKALEECPGSNAIIAGEGEKVADCFWDDLELAAITWQGSAWTEDSIKPAIELLKARNAALVYLPDNDPPGLKKAEKLARICANVGLPYIQINQQDINPECKDRDDIVDAFMSMGKEGTLARIEAQINRVLADYQNKIDNVANDEGKKQKLPPADIIAKEICEDYRDKLAFNDKTSTWMRYGADFTGVWSPESDEFIESIISKILDSKGITGYGSNSYVVNVVKKLRHDLIERNWTELPTSEYLPFINGVLNLQTGELLPHSPGYKLTWRLAREYSQTANDWSTINEFITHLTGGNEKLKHLIICYCAAVIKGRSDLQKFVHLIGLGGTGKGTMARLITALIGQENVLTTTMEDWCGNRFEGANAHNKRLVIFPDEDKQTGKLGKFLSLTGEDLIRAEEKGKKAFSFKYTGMVLVCSNLPIFVGDAASRVKRRCITIPCNNAVLPSQRRNLEQDFEPELAAFTNYLLSIPDEEVKRVLLGLEDIPEVGLEFWKNRIRVDSIAAWLNDRVIPDPLAKTAIGCDKNEGERGTPTTLFGSYSWHCKGTGDNPKSHKNFSPDLIELCQSVLGWKVEKEVTKTGKFIKGIRLRETGRDDSIPTHEYELMQALNSVVEEPEAIATTPEPPAPEAIATTPEPEPISTPQPEPQPITENATQTEQLIANLEQCQWEDSAVIVAAGENGIDLVLDAIAFAPIEKRGNLIQLLQNFNYNCQDVVATIRNAFSADLSDDEVNFIKVGLQDFVRGYGDAGRKIIWQKLKVDEKNWLKQLLK